MNETDLYGSMGKSSSESQPKRSLFSQLTTNGEYRRKCQLTSAVCCSYVVLGCVVVQIGTSLPDIQTLVRVDLETISWLFTAYSIGYILGSLVSGPIYDRWNRLNYMGISTVGCAAVSTALPWSPTFPVMVAVRVATGFFCGAIDTGANTIVPSIWGPKAGPFMHAVYLSYTVGGIVCPLITGPFMTARIDLFDNITSFNQEVSEKDSTVTGDRQEDKERFLLANFTYNTTPYNQTILNTFDAKNEDTLVHYAFIIVGLATLLTAFPYFAMSFLGNFDNRMNKDSQNTEQKGKRKMNKFKVYSIVLCVCAINVLYAATEDSIGAFLVTFSLQQLHWTKTQSVILMALYWGASCLGGLLGMLIVRPLGLARMTFAAYFIWIFSFFCALVCAQLDFHALIWVFIPLSGACMVVIIPNVISWTEANVCSVSGRIASLIVMSTGTGIATNPPFIGHLMEKYSIMCFLYVISIESVLCLACFTCAHFILRWLSGVKHQPNIIEIEVEEPEEKPKETECLTTTKEAVDNHTESSLLHSS